jgi:hypothetical protein
MEYWNNEKMEQWSNGIMVIEQEKGSIHLLFDWVFCPIFHHSTIPYGFLDLPYAPCPMLHAI